MPELSRFGGMVIYMLFKDIGQHSKPMFMFTMANKKLLLELTENFWQARCQESNSRL